MNRFVKISAAPSDYNNPAMSFILIRFLLVILTSFAVSLALAGQANAAEGEGDHNPSPSVLCPPGIYLDDPGGCAALGPSAYRTEMARQALILPLQPLPARRIDPSLGELPYQYAILAPSTTPVYGSLADAVAERSPISYIENGDTRYITYVDFAETENGRFFLRRSGGWVRVSSRISLPRNFPGGLVFQRTPTTQFGWIMPFQADLQSKRTPGYAVSDYTGRTFSQYEMVTIYSSAEAADGEWFMIGIDEWVDSRRVARVIPNTTPPEGVENGRWIEINLFEQTISVYENSQLIYATVTATGVPPLDTRPGLFEIYKKLESTPMSGSFEADRSDYYYLEDVPYTLYYDQARALHGAYWRSFMGYKQSHGCVNLTIADARWVFDWAEVGDWVYVWDPSGETPTDPSLYSPGGA
jgi:hypothetical protein